MFIMFLGLFLPGRDIIHKHGVSIRVLGDITLVPEYLQHAMAKAICNTQHNKKLVPAAAAAPVPLSLPNLQQLWCWSAEPC